MTNTQFDEVKALLHSINRHVARIAESCERTELRMAIGDVREVEAEEAREVEAEEARVAAVTAKRVAMLEDPPENVRSGGYMPPLPSRAPRRKRGRK